MVSAAYSVCSSDVIKGAATDLYSCAGICELSKDAAAGKFTRIRLKLSTPLLQYRPRSDTINTLLHEAIHAYFFITTSWQHSRGDDGTGHGVGFQLLADAINNHGDYEVTIYHTFHDEVDSYRTHVWQCDGPCRHRPPYFGLVKRSMNRAPGKSDSWWAQHEDECGGKYTKIREPELTKKQLEALSKKERAGRQKNKIDVWVKTTAPAKTEGSTSVKPKTGLEQTRDGETPLYKDDSKGLSSSAGQKRALEENSREVSKRLMVECPICDVRIAESEINEHLDVVHPYFAHQP